MGAQRSVRVMRSLYRGEGERTLRAGATGKTPIQATSRLCCLIALLSTVGIIRAPRVVAPHVGLVDNPSAMKAQCLWWATLAPWATASTAMVRKSRLPLPIHIDGNSSPAPIVTPSPPPMLQATSPHNRGIVSATIAIPLLPPSHLRGNIPSPVSFNVTRE